MLSYSKHKLQLSPQMAKSYSTELPLGQGCKINIEQPDCVLECQGTIPENYVSFNFFIRMVGKSTINGNQLTDNDVVIIQPNQSYQFQSSEDMTLCSITIRLDQLNTLFIDVEQNLQNQIIHLPKFALDNLRQFIQFSVKRLTEQQDKAEPNALNTFKHSLISMMIGILSLFGSPPKESRAITSKKNLHLFNQAKIMIYKDARFISIDNLMTQLKTSRRTLEYAFTKACGVSPAKYIKLVRMNEIKQTLSSEGSKTKTIGDIISLWGMWNLGRFSGEYHALFGELPSVTKNASELIY